MEETSDYSKELVGGIQNALQIDAVHDTMEDLYRLMNDLKIKAAGCDLQAQTALFRIYHVLIHLTDYGVPMERVGELRNFSAVFSVLHN